MVFAFGGTSGSITLPGSVDGNYSTSRGDGYITRATDNSLTFTGPTLNSNQLRRVSVYTASGVKYYEQGRNGVFLSIAGTNLIIFGAGIAPVPSTTLIVELSWANQDKGYDTSLQSIRTSPMYGPNSMYDVPFAIVDVANVAKSDTVVYYPSSTGMDMSGFADIAFDIALTAGAAASPIYVWLEAADDNTFPGATALPTTSPLNISYNCALVNSAIPLGNQSITCTAAAAIRGLWQIENINLQFVRVCFLGPAANANNSGAVKIFARRKYQ